MAVVVMAAVTAALAWAATAAAHADFLPSILRRQVGNIACPFGNGFIREKTTAVHDHGFALVRGGPASR